MADDVRRRGEIAKLLEGGYWLQVGDERRWVSAEEVAATTISTPPKRRHTKTARPGPTRRIVQVEGTVTSSQAHVVKIDDPDSDADHRSKSGRIKTERKLNPRRPEVQT
jgi:hypothetical protein